MFFKTDAPFRERWLIVGFVAERKLPLDEGVLCEAPLLVSAFSFLKYIQVRANITFIAMHFNSSSRKFFKKMFVSSKTDYKQNKRLFSKYGRKVKFWSHKKFS